MEVNLSIMNRVALLECLVPRGNKMDYEAIDRVIRAVVLSDDERQASGYSFQPTPDGKGYEHKWSRDIEKSVSFEGRALELVQESIKKLDTDGLVTPNNHSLFALFGVE